MHISGDKCHNGLSLDGVEFTPYELCELIQLSNHDIMPLVQRIHPTRTLVDGVLGVDAPQDLGDHTHDLRPVL
jgi:hypothetical protein